MHGIVIDDAWQTLAKGSHEVSSVGQQLVQDQVLLVC